MDPAPDFQKKPGITELWWGAALGLIQLVHFYLRGDFQGESCHCCMTFGQPQLHLTKRDLWSTTCVINQRLYWSEYIWCSDSIRLRFSSDLYPRQIPIIGFELKHFSPVRIWKEKVERLQCPWHLHKRSIHLVIYTDGCGGAQGLWWTQTCCEMERGKASLKRNSRSWEEPGEVSGGSRAGTAELPFPKPA